MAKVGRKSKYTPEIHNEIVKALSTGVSIKDTCAYAGITHETFIQWTIKYPEFSEATTRARSEGRIAAAAVVRNSAIGDRARGIPPNPDDAKWYLERTDPQTWGRTTKVILDVPPETQKRLQQWAQESGVDLAAVFEAMINQNVVTDAGTDSEE